MRPRLASLARSGAIATALVVALLLLVAVAAAAGPPFPAPQANVVVYDTAEALSAATEDEATRIIRTIEDRTGAEVVVYTQIKPGVDGSEARANAVALGNQWGVGRRGFDDGLVILFDLDETRLHGQVAVEPGAGFRAAFMGSRDGQDIVDDDMLPHLRAGDLDGAVLAALQDIDRMATPEQAGRLALFRQLNALIGFGGILVGVLLVVWWAWNWLRHGRDPDYLDDPSIYMPAPPPALTPATATVVLHGRTIKPAMTTALVDLASHGELRFEEEKPPLPFMKSHVTIQLEHRDDANEPQLALIRRHELGPAERHLLTFAREKADHDDRLDKAELAKLAERYDDFRKDLEAGAVKAKWFARAPASTTMRWRIVGGAELFVAGGLFVLGVSLPSDGAVIAALAIGIAGIITAIGATWMPAVTREGAMVRAMLSAYRRTLQKTMEMARSMQQVVERAALPWLEAPDQAVVWGVALGLNREVEDVLARSVQDLNEGSTAGVWLPGWYTAAGTPSFSTSGSGGFGGIAPGMMSSSAMPNFGGMMAAVSSIGVAASTTSSGGGDGFGGGGFGGGGGGSGGF